MTGLLAFSIYDVKAEAYGGPWYARTTSEGLRTFGFILKDERLEFIKCPGDYRLFLVGQFDQVTGVMQGLKEGPRLLEEGLLLVKEA